MSDQVKIVRIPWKFIEPLREDEILKNGSFSALDELRQEWQRHLSTLSEDERTRVRHRTLRRLAIETGIIERLYDLDWGLTLTLVAEGFARDVIERSGGRVDDRTLATLRSQMQSLEMVLDFVRDARALSTAFIKELHSAITRTQQTYTATDSLGRTFERELPRGEWKRDPNHVLRSDDTLLEYTPPEHVQAEMDHLISLHGELEHTSVHPIAKAAWLHHRFVQVHPFADGNGRVARALTLLVLEKHRYAPLVVDRWHRKEYVSALEAANGGDLQPLVRLFARLESAALTGELERPEEPPSRGLALDVAHTLASQIAAARKRKETQVQKNLQPRTRVIVGFMKSWFDGKQADLRELFRKQGLKDIEVYSDTEMPPDTGKSHWFYREVIESAHTAGHYADFGFFAGWSRLRIRLPRIQLRFIASLHGAGKEAGVRAVTTFALLGPTGDAEEQASEEVLSGDVLEKRVQRLLERSEELGSGAIEYITTTKDAFRFVHTEQIEDLLKRERELVELLDEGLAEGLARLLPRV